MRKETKRIVHDVYRKDEERFRNGVKLFWNCHLRRKEEGQ